MFIGFNVGYLDPTRELMVEILGGVGDLTCFGPGYQPMDVVRRGPETFVARHPPFDLLVCDELAIQDYSPVEAGEPLRFHAHACRFDPGLLRLGLDYQRFIQRYEGLRVLTLMQSDYYNWSHKLIERVESVGDYFIGWGEEFIRPASDFADVEVIPGGVNAAVQARANDTYLDFLRRRADRVVSCPQYVSAREACDIPLARRPHDWSLLGADYDGRVLARNLIDGAGIDRTGKWLGNLQNRATQLRLNLYNKYWTIAFLHWGFRRALRQSRYSFTCGGLLRWPIRKYFELPANGCVMVCEATAGFDALGYRDRTNVVACEARDILDADAWLRAHPDEAQAIADAGRAHVLATHSVEARIRHIGKALDAILGGTFTGSRWVDGAMTLRRADSDGAPGSSPGETGQTP